MSLPAASFALSLVALAISSWFALDGLRTSKNANALPVAIDLMREFRSYEFKRRQERVFEHLRQHRPTEEGFWGLPTSARDDVMYMSHFYDNIGLLVATGAADPRPLLAYLGGTADGMWRALEPFMIQERRRRTGPYQMFFEDFVARARELPSAQLRDDMGLRRIPEMESRTVHIKR